MLNFTVIEICIMLVMLYNLINDLKKNSDKSVVYTRNLYKSHNWKKIEGLSNK